MSKRLLSLYLACLLLFQMSACRRDKAPADTATGSEAGSSLPVTDGIADTYAPQDVPVPNGVPHAIERLTLNGVPCFEGDISAGLKAADYTLRIPEGKTPESLEIAGWVGFDTAVDCFGYRIDGSEAVYGLFATHTEEAVKELGGPYALRFTITVPLFELKPGAHTVTLLARLSDGTEEPLAATLTVSLEGVTVNPSIPYHSSLTHLGSLAFTDRGGSVDRGVDIIDAKLSGYAVEQDGCLRVSGWLALEGGVARYVWSADGMTWYPARTGGQTGEPSEGYFSSLGYENAVENALFTDLTLDLSLYHSRNIAVTVGGVPKNAPDKVVPFITVTGLDIPFRAQDIDFSFVSRADSNPEGIELNVSDLAYFFDVTYGAGSLRHVTRHDESLCYCYEGIHSLQAPIQGQFALTAELNGMTGASFLFVRATRSVISVDEVPIPLTNFYETDGLGLCGGAGIYARLADGTLTVVIKGLDPNAPYRIRNHTFDFPVTGTHLTMADNGDTVYILVDGKTVTHITMKGAREYPEHFATVSPYIQFAATATIVLPNRQAVTVENTLVASTCSAYCGIAVRGGSIHFTELRLTSFSETQIRTP
ncbi:MAG: hypothetical protein J6K29_12210 [Clostridia bacterium]|nr:hypothetical protein [Clostridia bacterium]